MQVPSTSQRCPGASELSEQFMNQNRKGRFAVRCGPQQDAPVTLPGDSNSSLELEDADVQVVSTGPVRVLPKHVYDNRQNTVLFNVPEGYRSVWDDGRLNPQRTERTLKDPKIVAAQVPKGYRSAWQDGRLNPNRGKPMAAGDAQMDQIWSGTIPKELKPVPTDGQIIVIRRVTVRDNGIVSQGRLSTRSLAPRQQHTTSTAKGGSR